MNYLLEKKPY